jgi:hypothetical protein
MLRADILPALGHDRAEAISKLHVMQVVEAVAARGSFVAAHHVLGVIRAIYNWANGTGRLEANPTLGLRKRNVSNLASAFCVIQRFARYGKRSSLLQSSPLKFGSR